MLVTAEFHLAPFPPLSVFLHAALILVTQARVGCGCGRSHSAGVQLQVTDPCQELLILWGECIHLLTVVNLLFVEQSLALCISVGLGAHCTGVSSCWISLNARWNSCCIERSVLVIADHTHGC